MSARMFKDLPRSKLWKQIARLNLISGDSSTAFKLGSQVKKLELVLLHKSVYHPGAGLKRFWRENLPVLKFHNDDVDFVLTRMKAANKAEVASAPCKIIVHNQDGTTHDVDCLQMRNKDILKKVIKATDAVPVPEDQLPTIPYPGKRT